MFICPSCKSKMALPKCSCGYNATQINNIWQLTDTPDIVTCGDGDKYIGYEYIGEAYSGNRKYVIEESDALFSKEISAVTGEGIFLDLACGDGCFTVSCAANGTRIIAGDISNKMLSILQDKAKHNSINLDNVTLCRMNALSLPLADESVDTVVANSVLHLISNPEKVVCEIYRVLRKGGVFICKDDAPGNFTETPFDNSLYFEIVNSIYREYWAELKKHGVSPQKYSWDFDKTVLCDALFSHKTEKTIPRGGEYQILLKDGFLPRFFGRGFSDQTNVPKELHDKVTAKLLETFREKYGESFADVACRGIETDMVITTYYK